MSEVGAIIKRNKKLIVLLSLILLAVVLRFVNLSYSDYTADEYGAFFHDKSTISALPVSFWDYIVTRLKGPMQYLIAYIPFTFTHNYRLELIERIPFALFSVAAVVVFYEVAYKFVKRRNVAGIAAFLFMVNGFISGFGRIIQYQNLNLFFSFAALYFYLDLANTKVTDGKGDGEGVRNRDGLLARSLLGTAMFSFSVLSHWDAVFVIAPIAYIFVSYLKRGDISSGAKVKLVVLNLLLGCLLLLPFLIPFVSNAQTAGRSIEYWGSRIGEVSSVSKKLSGYLFDFKAYNPFLTVWVYLVGVVASLFTLKKNKASAVFILWFLFNFLLFFIFVKKPGTHIYNFILPLIMLSSAGLGHILDRLAVLKIKKFKKLRLDYIGFFILGLVGIFLYTQSYLLFVDHKNEYPWEREEIFGMRTQKYTHKNRPRYLLGFPLSRNWNEINDWIVSQNEINEETLSYMTNESHSISEYYMEVGQGRSGSFYVIGIKTPWSFANDYKMAQFNPKSTVHKIRNAEGETVAVIYRANR